MSASHNDGTIKPCIVNVEMGHQKDSEDIFDVSITSDSENSLNEDDISNSEKNSMKSDAPDETKLTRFSMKYFSEVLDSLSKHHREIISKSCFRTLLLFEKCSMPYRFALWIAHKVDKVDVSSSVIIVRDKVIPLSKESVHIVLGLPVNYLDFLNFGMRKVLQDIPRIKVWKGSMIKKISKFDRTNKGVYGKRPVKDFSDSCYKMVQNQSTYDDNAILNEQSPMLCNDSNTAKRACPQKIIPMNLSQSLHDLSQNQDNISDNEDKLVMITLEDSETQNQDLTQHNEKENLPVNQQDINLSEKKKDSPDVVFLGQRQYTDNCFDITSKTNVLYNKINTFIVNPEKKLKLSTSSPGRVLLCNVDRNVGQYSSSQKPQHDHRRILQPARYSTDPHSPERPLFIVTQYDRQVYNVVCKISKSKFHELAIQLCEYRKVTVDIDDSFKPGGELSNFVTSVFYRYMFRLSHPSKSRKHYFFSSIGDDLLKDRSVTNFSVVKKCFDGASLARPVHTCNLVTFFPIIKNHHWFVFAIDLKAKRFIFLDSLYDEESPYHEEFRPKLISNFSLAWNLYVEEHPIDFNNFTVIYPPVPKQTNRY
uniref:Ubiquitin-like protease family profile domain-containing protein n=1 Tax=Oryza punctata TaxID=4537 RepID=A0A0E0JRF1_ORYPU